MVFHANRGCTNGTSVEILVLVAESELCKYITHSGSGASSVWVLALALISLLLETEQTEPHLEVVLKSTQFC